MHKKYRKNIAVSSDIFMFPNDAIYCFRDISRYKTLNPAQYTLDLKGTKIYFEFTVVLMTVNASLCSKVKFLALLWKSLDHLAKAMA